MEGQNDRLNHLGGPELLISLMRYIQLTLNTQTITGCIRADIITSHIWYTRMARGIRASGLDQPRAGKSK